MVASNQTVRNKMPRGCPKSEKDIAQTQEVLHKMGAFETMDLQHKKSPLLHDIRSHLPRRMYIAALAWRWIVVLLTGFSIGIFVFFFNWAIRGCWLVLYRTTERVIRIKGGFWLPYLTYTGMTLGFSLLATLPDGLADGGSISELTAYFNGVEMRGLLCFRAFAARTISGVFINAGNLVGVGEAPLVHAAAAMAGSISQLRSQKFGRLGRALCGHHKLWVRQLGGLFDNQKDHRDFVSLGASTGFTMAFITPIAGTIYPVEEGGLAFSPSRLFMAFTSSCLSYATLMVGVALFHSPGRFWDYKMLDLFQTSSANVVGGSYFMYVWEIPIFMVMGCGAGIMGGAFVAVNVRLNRLRSRYLPWSKSYLRVIEVLLLALVTATCWFVLTYASPCEPLPSPAEQQLESTIFIPNSILQLASRVTSAFPQLYCPAGQYATWGAVFWTPTQTLTKNFIKLNSLDASMGGASSAASLLPFRALLAYIFLEFALICWMYGTAVAFGAFTPAITIGAAYGQLIGQLVRHIAQQIGSDIAIGLPTYAIVGAAAMLAGFTRFRMTAAVLVAELSGGMTLLPAITLGVVFADLTNRVLGVGGIYENYNAEKCVPLLHDPVTDVTRAIVFDRLEIKDLMETELHYLPPVATLGQMVDILRSCEHQAFPLVSGEQAMEDDGRLCYALQGVISRRALLSLLKYRSELVLEGQNSTQAGLESEQGKGGMAHVERWPMQKKVAFMNKLRPFQSAAYTKEKLLLDGVLESERSLPVDLHLFGEMSPVVMCESASSLQAQHLFRHLGVHNVFVTPAPMVSGLLSRKDITLEASELALWRQYQLGQDES